MSKRKAVVKTPALQLVDELKALRPDDVKYHAQVAVAVLSIAPEFRKEGTQVGYNAALDDLKAVYADLGRSAEFESIEAGMLALMEEYGIEREVK